jgi:phosphatidylinositol alpha-1,6-mannosyltransferase
MRLLRNKKISVTYHGLDLVFPNVIYQKLLLPLVRSFDAIITVSDYTKEQCIARGFDKDKVHVIKNGVDHHEVPIDISRLSKKVIDSIDQEKKVIVAIGRTVKRKGFVWFVKNILPLLPAEYSFHLIGPEPKQNTFIQTLFKLLPRFLIKQIELLFGMSTEHSELKQLAENAELNNRFIWHKNVDHNTKNYIVSHSDMVVMPNVKVQGDMEGFGLVALEANMYNKPVIASKLEGITSAITDGHNGLLVPSEDVQAWYTAITDRVHNYNWNTRDFVINNFSWYRMVEGYRNLFISLASNTRMKTQKPEQYRSLKTAKN